MKNLAARLEEIKTALSNIRNLSSIQAETEVLAVTIKRMFMKARREVIVYDLIFGKLSQVFGKRPVQKAIKKAILKKGVQVKLVSTKEMRFDHPLVNLISSKNAMIKEIPEDMIKVLPGLVIADQRDVYWIPPAFLQGQSFDLGPSEIRLVDFNLVPAFYQSTIRAAKLIIENLIEESDEPA